MSRSVLVGFVVDSMELEHHFLGLFRVPCQYHSTAVPYSHMYPGRWTVGPLAATVP
jgi:hypothetical protein